MRKPKIMKKIHTSWNSILRIGYLAKQEVNSRFQRSRIGPFWLSLNTLITVALLGYLFNGIFDQEIDNFLPYVGVGYVIWIFISGTIIECCDAYIANRDYVLNYGIPLQTYVIKIVIKNLFILAYNVIPIFLMFLFFQKEIGELWGYSLLGGACMLLCVYGVGLLLAIICTRYRDVNLIVQNTLLVLFYITPIMWSIEFVPQKEAISFVYLNPILYLVETVRSPIIGENIDSEIYFYLTISALVICSFARYIFQKMSKKIAYWI